MADKLQAEFAKEKKVNKPKYLDLGIEGEAKKKLVARVLFDVEQDEAARKPYLDKIQTIIDLYEGKVQKDPAFPGGANVSTRIVTMVVEILHAILFPTVWNEDLHSWTPVERDDIQAAEGVNRFMKWDIGFSNVARTIDDWVKFLCLEGTVVTKTRWLEKWRWTQRRTPKPGAIARKAQALIRNFLTGRDEEVQIEEQDFTIDFVPKKMEYAVTDIIPLEDIGFPPFQATTEDDLDHIWHRTHPYIYDLEEKEERGFYEEGSSTKVSKALEESIRKEIVGTQKSRMEAEGSKMVDMKKESTPLPVIEWYGKYKVRDRWEEVVCWVEAKTETYLGATLLRKLNKFEKRPFRISQLIRRMNRMYGISMGELVHEYQKILDEMQNLNLNAGKLATRPPGFYRSSSGFKPEEIIMQPGIMIPVDDINDVKWMTIPSNSAPSHQEMRLIIELVERIASIGSFQSGQESSINRSRSTARGTLAIIAQGERRFSALGIRLQYHLAEIMGDRLRFYQQFMPPGMSERILGADGKLVFPDGVTPEDIAGEFDLQMSLDATGGSKLQKLEIAQGMYESYLPNPLVQEDPARFWEVSARPLKELGEVNIERYLGEKPKSLEERASELGLSVEEFKQQLAGAQAQQEAAAAGPEAGPPNAGQPPQGQSAPAQPAQAAPQGAQ